MCVRYTSTIKYIDKLLLLLLILLFFAQNFGIAKGVEGSRKHASSDVVWCGGDDVSIVVVVDDVTAAVVVVVVAFV